MWPDDNEDVLACLNSVPKNKQIKSLFTNTFEPKLENVKGNIMNELFEITDDGKTFYGFKLAMNSENKLVMEEKGTGKIIVVPANAVKEVLPYTIAVTSFAGGESVRNFTIEPGKVELNDIVISFGNDSKSARLFGMVTAIDTKSKGAPQFVGSRLKSEFIA